MALNNLERIRTKLSLSSLLVVIILATAGCASPVESRASDLNGVWESGSVTIEIDLDAGKYLIEDLGVLTEHSVRVSREDGNRIYLLVDNEEIMVQFQDGGRVAFTFQDGSALVFREDSGLERQPANAAPY